MLQLVAAALLLAAAPAPAGPLLQVTGAVPKPGTLTLAELESLKPVQATWESRGQKHVVTGVPVERILAHFGFTAGPMGPDKRPGWRQVVIASAPDGFQAVLSCAELVEAMGPTTALVIWKLDGKPLPPEEGPLRLVVLTDKTPARAVRSVSKLEVVDLTSRKD
jgi:DMSO/TMAO reductase YedYZ molybdopterin-dependent catalytic subunit